MLKALLVHDDHTAAFTEEFIKFVAGDGFGVRTKREMDLYVIHLLTKYTRLQQLSNKDASLALRIPASKVASLRYESRLRHAESDPHDYLREEFLVRFYEAHFIVDDNEVTFVVEDRYLRQLMDGELKAAGRFADTSFNRELVRLPLATLTLLLHRLWPEHYTDDKLAKLQDELQKMKGDGPILKVLKKVSGDLLKKTTKKLLTGGLL